MKVPKISMIAAIGTSRQLGLDNNLLMHIPEDLKIFKAITHGHTVIMGMNTYRSIITMTGDPLPNRRNIVISSEVNEIQQIDYPNNTEVIFVKDILTCMEYLNIINQEIKHEVFVIGGGQTYEQFMGLCDNLYLTYTGYSGPADVYFPDYTEYEWSEFRGLSFNTGRPGHNDMVLRVLTKLNYIHPNNEELFGNISAKISSIQENILRDTMLNKNSDDVLRQSHQITNL